MVLGLLYKLKYTQSRHSLAFIKHEGVIQVSPNLSRPTAAFALAYQLPGLKDVSQDNLLKFHTNLLTMLLKMKFNLI
jgi:hypothetical protein